jgi:hypothetical protein
MEIKKKKIRRVGRRKRSNRTGTGNWNVPTNATIANAPWAGRR